jgi:hypothetical protein
VDVCARSCVRVCVRMCIYMYVCVRVCVRVRVSVHMSACVSVGVSASACVFACVVCVREKQEIRKKTVNPVGKESATELPKFWAKFFVGQYSLIIVGRIT